MSERMIGGEPMPPERRYELFPAREGDELFSVPEELRRRAEKEGWSDDQLKKAAVTELARFGTETTTNEDLKTAAETYLKLAEMRRDLRAKLKILNDTKMAEAKTGLALGSLFEERGTSLDGQIEAVKQSLALVETDFFSLIGLMRGEFRARRDKPRQSEVFVSNVFGRYLDAREALFGLLRRKDAARKYMIWRTEQGRIDDLRAKTDIFSDVLRVRQKAEDLVSATEAERRELRAAGTEPPAPGLPIHKVITDFLGPDLDCIVDHLIDVGAQKKPKEMSDAQFRIALRDHVLAAELALPADLLRRHFEDKRDQLATEERSFDEMLRDPRNGDLAEFIRDEDARELLRLYHVERKRFIPIGEIKDFIDSLDTIVTSPRGRILRALLYGPPGTGKTEGFREIGARHGQRVRVISLHETSTFETLIGVNQIPLPKAETIRDAEVFWVTIKDATPEEIALRLPPEILAEFGSTDDATHASCAADFKKWFEAKLNAARVVSALGAVSPDDPRVREAYQSALAAWLDQPLADGLMQGDLIVLDEADRAGAALEGLQDVLTRYPGDLYHPPGRKKPFRIHPNARVVMTANWGDVQTEQTAGGGRLAAPILSRVIEKRKVDYASPETELKLFEVMTSTPDGASLLMQTEYNAAAIMIEKVFPRLRDLYLRPGDLNLVTPISVRTLENIARRLIDETTRTRLRGKDGKLIHIIETIWAELAAGPFREDQRETILRELAKICADQGLFNVFEDDPVMPRHLQVARLTELPSTVVGAFLGGVSGGLAPAIPGAPPPLPTATELPAGFSFGRLLEGDVPAKNEKLFAPIVYRSALGVKQEEERAWRRAIEEKGGNPETQRALERLIPQWLAHRKEASREIGDDFEKLFEDEVKFLGTELDKITVSIGDVALFHERIPELFKNVTASEFRRAGLILSLVSNQAISAVPVEERNKVEFHLDLSKTPQLDFLGYGLPAGTIVGENGEAGDYAGRELTGGTLRVEKMGDKAGYGMISGSLIARIVGNRACQRMMGGVADFAVVGDRLAMDAGGGTIKTNTAGERAGIRSSAKISISGGAGKLCAQELGELGVIEVGVAPHVGGGIKGTLRIGGRLVYDRGRKVD